MFRALLLMLASTVAFAQEGLQYKNVANPKHVASLSWMAGSWVQDKGKTVVLESWVGPNHGLMAAVNVSAWDTGKTSYEFLRIVDTAESMSYMASPSGREPVEFKFKEAIGQRVVFENEKNDYPQRIIYWRDGDKLGARIEGKLQGRDRSDEWLFVAATPGATYPAPPKVQ